MPRTKKPVKKAAKKPVKRTGRKKITVPNNRATVAAVKTYRTGRQRISNLMARRPHRSFRLTRRRDYKRSLKLPGYWSFTISTLKLLLQNWRLFGGLVLVYVVASIVIGGLGQQDAYSNLSDALKQSSGDLFKGNFGAVGQAGLLLVSSITTGLTPDVTQAQSVLAGLAVFFGWLTAIWLLRNTLAGHRPRLRDGLYNSGSPVLATIIVGFVILLQLLPSAVGLIIYTAAQNSGLLESGVSAVLVWIAVTLFSLITLYWLSSSLIALVIVTLPGMFPLQALRAAGDMVVGRRLRVLYRLVWLVIVVAVVWLIIMIPIILFDSWIKSLVSAISWLPLVPFTIIAMSSLTLVYASSYIYLLYRRIVDDDASPA